MQNNISDKQKLVLFAKLKQKHFIDGSYRFMMFMVTYFARVKKDLKMDYESFMIVQVVASNAIYQIKKKGKEKSYEEIGKMWDEMVEATGDKKKKTMDETQDMLDSKIYNNIYKNRLTISSISLVLNLPKETVRRKIQNLIKKRLLISDTKTGLNLGEEYKKIYSSFVPTTARQISSLLRSWRENNLLQDLLDFEKK
tara:strand:+ start:31 stop:621 length:591 start_codon:yes stop_codon:yes gene_type:complete